MITQGKAASGKHDPNASKYQNKDNMGSMKKPSAKTLALILDDARDNIGDGCPGIELVEDGGITASFFNGALYAAFRVNEDRLEYVCRCPEDKTALNQHSEFYTQAASPPGFIRYERPLSSSPTPDLEADWVTVSGRAFFEMKQATDLTPGPSINEIDFNQGESTSSENPPLARAESNGGPYVALPESALENWQGYDDPEYDKLDYITSGGALIDVSDTKALLLGSPENLYWFPNDQGGLLAQTVSFRAAEEDVLREIVDELPKTGWKGIRGPLNVEEPLVIFDGAAPGGDAESEGIRLELAAGQYQVSQRTHKEKGEFELILVRLQRKA